MLIEPPLVAAQDTGNKVNVHSISILVFIKEQSSLRLVRPVLEGTWDRFRTTWTQAATLF